MAVTNYRETNNYLQNGGLEGKVKDGFGNGTPVGDAVHEDDAKFPIGSRYTDLSSGKIYTKTAASTWTDSSIA